MTAAVGIVTPEGLETSGADPGGVYQIGSVTKVFTALLLALEVVEGRLTLETRVGELAPALDELPVGDVTLGALVTHTGGLPRLPPGMWRKAFGAGARNPYADIDEPALYAAVGAVTPRPRSRPVYSNLGFGLLGTALARHLRTSYDEAVRARIATPLGMSVTRSHPDAHQPGHTRRGRVRRQVWTFDALAGAGALWSSVDDLALLRARAPRAARGGAGEAIRLTQQPRVRSGRMEQAMAWIRLSGKDGELLFHNGGTAGYRSFVGVDVDRRRGVVVLGDSDRSVDRQGSGWPAAADHGDPGRRVLQNADVRHGDRTLGCALLALAPVLLVGCGAEADDPGAKATPEAATLDYPRQRGGVDDGATTDAAQDNAKAYLIRAGRRPSRGTAPLFAEYERDDGATLAYLGFNVDPTSAYADQLADTPEVVVDVALADAGILDRQALDAGELGGALACGTLPAEYQVDGLTCAWADETTSAQVTLVVPELGLREAAVLTRAFREAVTDR